MKRLSKMLSVMLSLAMCAGMVLPAFAAATFTELQGAIDGGESVLKDGLEKADETKTDEENYKIKAENKDGIRYVTLYEDVAATADEKKNGIVISDKDITLDLNGHEVTINEGMKITDMNEGDAEMPDGSTPTKTGSVITVQDKGTLTLKDSGEGGRITGVYNNSFYSSGGVKVNGGTFIMEGGEISGNVAHSGAGVTVNRSGTFEMRGGTISGNSGYFGGGAMILFGGEMKLSGGEISGNTAYYGGGVCALESSPYDADVTLGKVDITENHATGFGGGVYFQDADVVIDGARIEDNTAEEYGSAMTAIYQNKNKAIEIQSLTIEGNIACQGINASGLKNISWDGKCLKGWRDIDSEKVYSADELKLPMDRNNAVGLEPVLGEHTYDDGKVTTEPTNSSEGERTYTCTACGATRKESIPALTQPAVPVNTGSTTEIDAPAVPLAAGPVTRAEFVDFLWRHEGEPETDSVCTFADVPADHEYVLALAWAEQSGIAVADENGTFEPDELVTVAAVREILGNLARVFEMDVDVDALVTLTGEDDEAVLNCDEVLAEFFGEELAQAA